MSTNKKLIIEKDEENIFRLSGEIDSNTSQILRQELQNINSGNNITLDFTNVNYISSSGLRELLIEIKKLGKENLLLLNVQPEVDEIFKTTGFSELLNYTLAQPNRNIFEMSFRDLLNQKILNDTDKVIIKSSGIQFTWRDIDKGISNIASKLYALGVNKGTHVAICGTNSVNWILTFFAIQKLGAIAVLVNPRLTISEIVTLSNIGDITHFCYGNMSAIINENSLSELTNPNKSMIQEVFDFSDNLDFFNMKSQSKHLQTTEPVMSDDICVMIFTSGSTGKPKGVLLSAYNLLISANYCVENLHMNENDIICAILPLFHIFGLTAVLFASLITGSLIILPESLKADELLNIIKSEKCTILHSVPTVLLKIVNSPSFSKDIVSSLRASYLSGAPVSEAQLKMLMDMFPNNHFVRRYGLSEMTPVTCTQYDDNIEHVTKTVGKPIKNMIVKIQNPETHEDCLVNVTGEIIVQGNNLMCSYYKLPLEDQPLDKDGFLHTGDLGFFDNDGYIHFIGRIKEIIIRGGENIMPNEVASAISAHESVADVKVVGIPDKIYGEVVAAAIVLKEGFSFDKENLLQFLSTRLAKYKTPTYFFIYDKLPTLANGKIDGITLKKQLIEKISLNDYI